RTMGHSWRKSQPAACCTARKVSAATAKASRLRRSLLFGRRGMRSSELKINEGSVAVRNEEQRQGKEQPKGYPLQDGSLGEEPAGPPSGKNEVRGKAGKGQLTRKLKERAKWIACVEAEHAGQNRASRAKGLGAK